MHQSGHTVLSVLLILLFGANLVTEYTEFYDASKDLLPLTALILFLLRSRPPARAPDRRAEGGGGARLQGHLPGVGVPAGEGHVEQR